MPRPPSRPDDRDLPGMEQQPGAGGGRDRRRDHRGAAGHRPGDQARSDGRCRRRVAGAFRYDIEARWRIPMVCDGSPGPPGQAHRAVVSPVGRSRNARHEQQAYPRSDYQTTYGHEIEYRYSPVPTSAAATGEVAGIALKGGYLPPGFITHIVIVIPWWHPRTLGCSRAGDGAIVALWLLAAVRAYRIHRRADGAIRPLLATHRREQACSTVRRSDAGD